MKSLFLILVTSDIHQVTPTELVGVVISILSVSAIFITSFITFHPNHRDAIESHRYHLIDHDREVPYWGNEKRATRQRNHLKW